MDPVSPWAAHRPHDGDEVASARFLSIARLKIAQIARASSTTGPVATSRPLRGGNLCSLRALRSLPMVPTS